MLMHPIWGHTYLNTQIIFLIVQQITRYFVFEQTTTGVLQLINRSYNKIWYLIITDSTKLFYQLNHFTMGDVGLLEAFVQLLKALNHRIQQPSQLYSGIILAQFLCTVENSQIKRQQIIKDESVLGSALSNLKLIQSQIQRYNRIQFKNQLYHLECNISQIFTATNQLQLLKLVKQCFVIAVKAPNNSIYINKVLTLEENSQLLLANFIKQDSQFLIKQNPESDKSQSRQCSQIHALDLIDKIYDLEQQNEKLSMQIRRLQSQQVFMNQNTVQLNSQIQILKQANQDLKKQLSQAHDAMLKLGSIRLKSAESQNRNDQCRLQLEMLSIKYKQQMQLASIQNQSTKRKYETKIIQLQGQLKYETEVNVKLRDQVDYYQKQVQQLLKKFSQYQRQISQANTTICQYQKITSELRQSEATLKLQINYKNLQLQQLKQMVHAANNGPESYYDKAQNYKNMKSSKMLASEFANTCSTPNLRSSSTFRAEDQLKSLRGEIKELQKQIEKSKQLKFKIKQLEYEKNKLMKILKQYQVSRGEENDILTGCFYELHQKYINREAVTPFSNFITENSL